MSNIINNATIEDLVEDIIRGLDICFDMFNQFGVPYVRNIPYLFILHSVDKKIVKINKYARDILGNVEGMSSWSIYSTSLTGSRDSPLDKCIKTQNITRTKTTLLSKYGKIHRVWVLDVPISIQNKLQYIAEYCLDLDEVSNIERKILNTELKFQQLFEEVPCHIFLINKEYKVVSINKKFKEDIGDRVGNYCYLLYNRNSPCIDCPIEVIKKDGEPKKCEHIILDKNSKRKYMLVWIAPIKDSNGNIKEFMEILTDVTDIKEMQKHLAELGILISSVSHEIKNMFTSLDGSLYRLNKAINKSDINLIQKNFNSLNQLLFRIKRLVVDILDYAKKRKMYTKKVNIKFLINYIEDFVKSKIESNNIKFSLFVSKKDFYLYIDEQKFLSALINVIDNAIDACIADSTKEDHKVQLVVKRIKNRAIFKIIDNGIGMDEETINHIFEPFFSSKGPKGTGLGLFIARDIVKKHRGEIFIRSIPGEGTEFTIELPIYYFSS